MTYIGETIKIGPHNIEIKYSGTGSFSPWHADVYEKQKSGPLFCTADVAYFMRVDGKDIYKITYSLNDVRAELNRIASNYDFYPAEMEEEFKQFLLSDDLKKQPDIEEEKTLG